LKVKELIAQCNNKVKDLVENDYWIDRFNEALADLAPVMQLEGVKVAELPRNMTVALPKDIWNDTVILCRLLENSATLPRLALDDFESNGYKVFGSNITVQGSFTMPDTLKVWYKRFPGMLSYEDLEKVPEIPVPFQHILKYYAMSKWWQTEEDRENEASYWQDYVDMKQQLFQYTLRRKKRYHDLRLRIE
jgi:hypothetical protein